MTDTTQPGITHEEMVERIKYFIGDGSPYDSLAVDRAILASLIRLWEIERMLHEHTGEMLEAMRPVEKSGRSDSAESKEK